MQWLILNEVVLTAATCGAMFFATSQLMSARRNERLKWPMLASCVVVVAVHALFLERGTIVGVLANSQLSDVLHSLLSFDLFIALAFVMLLASVCFAVECGASRLLRGPSQSPADFLLDHSIWPAGLVACALAARSAWAGRVVPLVGESALETGIVMPFVAIGGVVGSVLVLLALRVRRPVVCVALYE